MNALPTTSSYDYVHIGSYEHALSEDILYCEGERNYTHVHFTDGRKTFVSTNLGLIESRLLGRGFKRINRSYLVNPRHVRHHDRYEITLTNGSTLPIARRRRAAVQEWLSELGMGVGKFWNQQMACFLMLLLFAPGANAQLSVYSLPTLAPDSSFVLPLKYYGYKKSHYSVLVKVRLASDTIYYTIPGMLPTGDSFDFLLKTGKKRQGDTLYVNRRGGVRPVQLAEIWVGIFHKSDHLRSRRYDRDFTKLVIGSYYDGRTQRGNLQTTSNKKRVFSLRSIEPKPNYNQHEKILQ